MKLASSDGAEMVLVPVSYQFPGRQTTGSVDWDANWLVIRGEVTTAQGREWSFEDPCITTWEAQRLTTWLRDLAESLVSFPVDDNPSLIFTEPNLAFGLEAGDGERMRLLVYLSLECGPPWIRQAPEPAGIYEFAMPFEVSAEDLVRIAGEFDSDLDPFPPR